MKDTKLVLFAFFGLLLFVCTASAQIIGQKDAVALYRLYNSKSGDHLYTTSCQEKDNVIRSGSYVYEGLAGYISTRQARRTVALYRLQLANGRHFYTTDVNEMNTLTANGGNISEGITGYLADESVRNTSPFYRLVSGDKHFYTTDDQEKNDFLRNGNAGRLEGTIGYLWRSGDNPCDYGNSEQNDYPTIYSGTNFDGESLVIKKDWNVNNDWDGSPNTISSIRVPRGWYIVIYRRENFRGESYDISTDTVFNRNNDWRNRIRSIKVYKGRPPR